MLNWGTKVDMALLLINVGRLKCNGFVVALNQFIGELS